MYNSLLRRLKEATILILPIMCLVVVLSLSSSSLSLDSLNIYPNHLGPVFVSFLISIVPLVIGLALFNLGADKSMGRIGTIVGNNLTKKKTLVLLCFGAVLIGLLTTMAGPNLEVLSLRLFPFAKNWILIVIVSLGVGLMLLAAILRVIYQKPLKMWYLIFYGVVFALGCLADKKFFAMVFDASGATSDSIAIPFILALGIGFAQVRGGKNPEEDAFGYAGLCAIGPLISVIVMAIVLSNSNFTVNCVEASTNLTSFSEMGNLYLHEFSWSCLEVAISLLPIILFFIIYNFFLKIKGQQLLSIITGFIYTYFGLVLFLTGANSGLIPAASSLGESFSNINLGLFILIGFILGFLMILAEPNVHVLAERVNDISSGVISKKMIYLSLCIATGLAAVLNIIRVRFNIPFAYFAIGIYLVVSILAIFVPDIYVALAFDSAGVSTGSLSACFLLPLFISYTRALYNQGVYGSEKLEDVLLANGFGCIGMVGMMPLLTVEILGVISIIRKALFYKKVKENVLEEDDSQVVHLPI